MNKPSFSVTVSAHMVTSSSDTSATSLAVTLDIDKSMADCYSLIAKVARELKEEWKYVYSHCL